MKKTAIIVGIVLGVLLLSLIVYRLAFLKWIESHELGYKFNARTGQTTVLKHTGYAQYTPFVEEIHVIDLRPAQVCLNANSRVLNCKLVRFNPKGLDLFLSWHGREDYIMSTSNTSGYNSNFVEILKSYAYDGSPNLEEKYPFLEIMPANEAQKDTTVASR